MTPSVRHRAIEVHYYYYYYLFSIQTTTTSPGETSSNTVQNPGNANQFMGASCDDQMLISLLKLSHVNLPYVANRVCPKFYLILESIVYNTIITQLTVIASCSK